MSSGLSQRLLAISYKSCLSSSSQSLAYDIYLRLSCPLDSLIVMTRCICLFVQCAYLHKTFKHPGAILFVYPGGQLLFEGVALRFSAESKVTLHILRYCS